MIIAVNTRIAQIAFSICDSGQNAGPLCSQKASKSLQGSFGRENQVLVCVLMQREKNTSTHIFSNLSGGKSPYVQLPETPLSFPCPSLPDQTNLCLTMCAFRNYEGSDREGRSRETSQHPVCMGLHVAYFFLVLGKVHRWVG